jgi:hypothetical protein
MRESVFSLDFAAKLIRDLVVIAGIIGISEIVGKMVAIFITIQADSLA